MKQREAGDFTNAWGGIASIQWLLSATWTALRRRDVGVAQLARWMSESPANLVGLSATKGRLEPGCDADLVVWDPDASFTVRSSDILHRHETAPYLGRELFGEVHRTYLRGKLIFDRGEVITTRPGKLLLNTTAK
jgi:allantoinase